MAKGVKTGGRRTGTPNRSTVEVKQTLEALGCDPIEGMARIAMDESQPMALRASMYRELTQYLAPKRKALEHGGALLLHGLDLETDLFTPTFAVGRVAGWIGHCFEQQKTGRLIRPQSVYIGEYDRKWTPVAQR